jgi:hypothetical protein
MIFGGGENYLLGGFTFQLSVYIWWISGLLIIEPTFFSVLDNFCQLLDIIKITNQKAKELSRFNSLIRSGLKGTQAIKKLIDHEQDGDLLYHQIFTIIVYMNKLIFY